MFVEALFAQASVEALDVRRSDSVCRAREVQLDAMAVGPCVKRSADELRTLSVTSMAGFPRVSIKRCRTSATRRSTDRGVDVDREAGPGEVVDDGEDARTTAVIQHIDDEVERPAVITLRRVGGPSRGTPRGMRRRRLRRGEQ